MSRSTRLRAHSFSAAVALAVVSLSILAPGRAHATVISASSSAYGESIDLTVTPLIPGLTATVTSGPLPFVSGSAPPAYNFTGSIASATVAGVLSTGLLAVAASSNVDGTAGAKNAQASATVNALGIGPLGGLLSLGATTIQSTALVSGDFGALSATGTTTIENLVINGIPLLAVNPAANTNLLTVLLGGGSLTVTANKQTITGNGTTNAGIIDDALDISFVNFLGTLDGVTGLINGDIIIDQSQAMLVAAAGGGGGGGGGGGAGVPEPSSLLLLAGGFALFAAARYRPMFRGACA